MTHRPTEQELLADLTEAQREAVTHLDGPLLILAGAGSGKTRVITRRVAWLMTQGVRPHNILAITFTNKAAGEMRQRIEALVPETKVWISTFHSMGVRLLRMYADRFGIERNFTVYDQSDRTKIVKLALDAARVDNVRFTPEAIQGAISKAKNQLLSPEKFNAQAADFFHKTVAQVYPVYERRMREANAVDFDDLLYWPALGLRNNAELRAELDSRFRYILIDEYQDTNKAQYEIARLLSIDYPNLCVVGDPDQSIYAFRGSDIRNILDFERDYPRAQVIPLERNYRSTKAILHAASAVIAHNRERKRESLTTENPDGEAVTVLTFESGLHEADDLAKRINEAVKNKGRTYRDHAIFLRINALSRTLESAFIKHRVPYQIVRGLAFYERKENKDVLAYLRLLLNPRDDLSFLRAVNEPARGIGKVSLDHLQAYAEPREISLLSAAAEVDRIPQIKGKPVKGLKEFHKLVCELTRLADQPPDEVLRQVLDLTGYREMLATSEDPEDEDRLANIEELITAARQFTAEDSSRTLSDFLENITLASDLDGWDERQDCVSVMTLHAAKGLEFPVVYMAAIEQGLLPHERSLNLDKDLEEERRLCFVGMTRAKEELYLCHARVREFRGQTHYAVRSMFLEELPTEHVKAIDLSAAASSVPLDRWRSGSDASEEGWIEAGVRPRQLREDVDMPKGAIAVGMTVAHDAYGRGRVTSVSGYGAARKAKIRFGSGEKTFLVDKAKLRIVG